MKAARKPAFILWCLNAVDTTSTTAGLLTDRLHELNPLMDYLWSIHPITFVATKMFLGTVVCLMALKAYSKATLGIVWGAVTVYSMVMILHVVAWYNAFA